MSFFGGLYRTAVAVKDAGVSILKLGYDDAKKALGYFKPSNLPLINNVSDSVRTSISSLFAKTRDYFARPFKEIKRNREQITDTLQQKWDERTLQSGADNDQSLARLIQDFDDSWGASEIEVEEGKWLAAKRKLFREWARETAVPALDRYPAKPGSDEDVIESEERDHKKYSDMLKKKLEPHPPNHSDRSLLSQLVHLINLRRDREGLSPLRLGKKLTEMASGRTYERMTNEFAQLPPLRYVEAPPLERAQFEETLPVARYRSGKPQFHITQEKRKRMVPGSLKRVDDDHYTVKFFETDEEFAQRAREQQELRSDCEYDDFFLSMDFSDDNYPSGDPHQLLDFILSNPAYREALMGEKNTMGVGIVRKEGKVMMNFLMEQDDTLDPDEDIPLEPRVMMNDDWWFFQIPEDVRDPDDERKINFQELYDEGFDSGYSLYNLYLFVDKIEKLGKTHRISIPHVSFHPQEEILNKPYDLLHIQLKINDDSLRTIKLVKGKELVDIPRESDDKKHGKKSVGNVLTLDEYFDQIKDLPEPQYIEHKYSDEKPKRRRASHP